jgi:uncharacterized protein with FMN-binding domain
MDSRVAAVSSAVVLAIYGAGYELTQRTVDIQRQIVAAARSVPRSLRDGVYGGTGSGPYGDVSVSITVIDRRIADVQITGVTTFFSADWIARLPAEVIRRQGPSIDAVSGATGSTAAFDAAVADALRRASAPGEAAA